MLASAETPPSTETPPSAPASPETLASADEASPPPPSPSRGEPDDVPELLPLLESEPLLDPERLDPEPGALPPLLDPEPSPLAELSAPLSGELPLLLVEQAARDVSVAAARNDLSGSPVTGTG
jgi:hypothetical protein